MERQPAGVAIVERRPGSTAEAAATPRHAVVLRAALLAVLVGFAYHYSLWTLVRSGNGGLVGVAVAALLAAVAIVRQGRSEPEPAIDDRYTDFIVGVPLLAGGVAVLVLLPSHLSVFFWFWRLDLGSIPFFVAGAIALLFGVRALWRLRLAIGALALVWALREISLLSPLAGGILAGGVVAAALGVARRPTGQRNPRRDPAGRRPVAAASLVLAVTIAAAIANGRLDQFQPLLRDSGAPRLTQAAVPVSMDGWTMRRDGAFGWIAHFLGPDAIWDRYTYGRLGQQALIVDVLSSAERNSVGGKGLDVFYRLHGQRLASLRDVTLGMGVVGHAATYVDPGLRSKWDAVYWDWPVGTANGIRYERIVVSASANPGTTSPTALIEFGRALIAAEAQ